MGAQRVGIDDDLSKVQKHQVTKQNASTVLRALDILDYLESQKDASNTEISKKLGLHKSTVSRLMSTMKSRGYVSRNLMDGRYSLGIRLVSLAAAKLAQIDLRAVARPVMEELMLDTGESVYLAVLNEGQIVYIDTVDAPHRLVLRFKIGNRSHPHYTSLGKAILAEWADEEIEKFIAQYDLPRLTPNTITDAVSFMEHLRSIRARGFAVNDEESEEGIRCVGAAIKNASGRAVAALSIAGSTIRISRDRIGTLGKMAVEACNKISASLGYSPIKHNSS